MAKINLSRTFATRRRDAAFIRDVIAQYEKLGRHDLAWRKSITPYRILVSEVMLQQTQVARVLPKFAAWIKRYPTLARLREATLADVLSLWEGLGYQRRAKALLELARRTGRLPRCYEALVALPGIGPYTASAIMAFAYDEFPPHLIETNIRTALIEYFHRKKEEVADSSLRADLERLANYREVKHIGARHWHYALMDYGAHLKSARVSHNAKSKHYRKQSPYKGSVRELRAKVLFAVARQERLPSDDRLDAVIAQLAKEGYIARKGKKLVIA